MLARLCSSSVLISIGLVISDALYSAYVAVLSLLYLDVKCRSISAYLLLVVLFVPRQAIYFGYTYCFSLDN